MFCEADFCPQSQALSKSNSETPNYFPTLLHMDYGPGQSKNPKSFENRAHSQCVHHGVHHRASGPAAGRETPIRQPPGHLQHNAWAKDSHEDSPASNGWRLLIVFAVDPNFFWGTHPKIIWNNYSEVIQKHNIGKKRLATMRLQVTKIRQGQAWFSFKVWKYLQGPERKTCVNCDAVSQATWPHYVEGRSLVIR